PPIKRIINKCNNSQCQEIGHNAREALHGVGMIVSNKKGSAYPEKDYNNINKFLNRLLGCPVNLQNAIFTFFSDVLTTVILQAKRSGKWDMGIMDLGSNNEIATRKETKFYVLNNKSDTCRKVELHTVLVERGINWEKALEIYRQNLKNSSSNEIGFYLLNQVKNNNRLAILAVPSQDSCKLQERKLPMTLSIYRPNTGLQTSFETFDSLNKKFKKVSSSEAKAHWIEHYRKSASECIHRFREGNCSNIRNCDIGLRTRKFYILAGSVLTVWSRVENLLCHLTGSSQFRLQIIRVRTSDNLKIVGCVIPAMCIKKIDSFLSSISSKSYVQTHMTSQVTANDDKKSTKIGAQNYKKSIMNCAGDYENTNFINQNSKNFNTSNEKNQFSNFDITMILLCKLKI
ncbi:strawberry notch-like isoform X1, partial [Brachionus plicatilis]